MGLNFVDAERLGIVAATLLDAFEYVRVYRPGWRSGLVLLASEAPFDMSATAGAVIDADPELALHLGITRPEDIEAALALDTQAVRRIAAGSRTNRDRHDRLGPATARLVRAAAEGAPYYEPPAVAVREITTDVRALARHGRTGALAQLAMTHPDAAERAFARALLAESRGQRDARDRELAAVLEAQPGHPGVTAGERAALERMRCDAHLARGEDRRALERLDIATRLDGGEPEDALRRARAAAVLGDHAVATESLERVLSWLEGSLQAGQRSEALATLDAVLQALPPSAVEAAVQTRMDRLR
jgi:tetratricopeptide (TPR) repeat protein